MNKTKKLIVEFKNLIEEYEPEILLVPIKTIHLSTLQSFIVEECFGIPILIGDAVNSAGGILDVERNRQGWVTVYRVHGDDLKPASPDFLRMPNKRDEAGRILPMEDIEPNSQS